MLLMSLEVARAAEVETEQAAIYFFWIDLTGIATSR